MLWYVPAGLEAGYEPNTSLVARGTSPEEISGLKKCLRDGWEREHANDWTAAVELYRAALVRFPQFAEFHFRLGECFLRLGQIDEARRHLQAALDNDGRPSRQTRPFRKTLTEVAAACSIPVVVTEDALRPHTELGILDRSLFHDFVHPTLRGHYYMGIAGAERLRTSSLLESRFGPPADIPAARFTDAVQEFQIDRTDVARALRDVATGLRWHARIRFDGTRRIEQADESMRLAERLEAGQIEPGEDGTEGLN